MGDASRRRRLGRSVAAVMAFLLLLTLWPAWGALQVGFALMGDPVARHAVATCEQLPGWALVYRVTRLPHGGVVCSAVVREDSFYSYMLGRMVWEHWLRLDCEVNTPFDPPYCRESALPGLGQWPSLLGPPPPDVAKMDRTGAS